MRKQITLLLAAITCLVTAVSAGDGHIPVWEPTIIDEDGVYLLIRDVEAPSGSAIRIVAPAERVRIDLNGFSVRSVNAPAIDSKAVTTVTIRNGAVESDDDGIDVDTAEWLVIENVIVSSGQYGIYLQDVRNFAVRRNTVEADDYGALIFADAAGIQGTIADNVFRVDGFRAIFTDDASPDSGDVSTVHVQRNQIKGAGVEIEYSYGSMITDNSIDAPGSANALVLDNTTRSTVSGNVVHASSYGISVRPSGDYNLVENNQVIGGNYGLRFEGNFNVYRGNMVRDYAFTPVLDSGVGNTNAGGNVF